MTVVAALAVLFETLPGLRGGFGNVAYFFLVPMLMWSPSMIGMERGAPRADFLGFGTIMPSMMSDHARAFPELRDKQHNMSMGFNVRGKGNWDMRTFRWNGVRWNLRTVASRWLWVALGAGIALVAAVPFDRFDTARSRGQAAAAAPGSRRRWFGRARPQEALNEAVTAAAPPRVAPASLSAVGRKANFPQLVLAELGLVTKGVPRVAALAALGLFAACAFAPLGVARTWLLPFAWFLPILVWSGIGSRSERHRTSALLFSSPRPLARLLPAEWLAGVVIALATAAPVGVRFAMSGDLASVAAWLTGACFIPTLALALGVWSGSGKAFEVLYTALWYTGPLNRVAFLDYLGQSRESAIRGTWLGFAAATLVLAALAILGRRRQLRA